MLVKATTLLFIETEEGEMKDRAAAIGNALEGGLRTQMDGFPEGECISVDVETVTPVSDEEANERGLVE